MQEYEVLIETINPCGGEAHANKEFREIETDSPEAYVREQGRYPILDSGKNAAGDTDPLYVHRVKDAPRTFVRGASFIRRSPAPGRRVCRRRV